MNKKIFCGVLAAIPLIFFGNADAAMKLSVAESVDLAFQNNDSITQAEANKDSAKWNLSAARRSAGPSIQWNSQAYRIGGRDYRSANHSHELYGDPHTQESVAGYLFGNEDFPVSYNGTVGSYRYKNTFSNNINFSYPIYTGGRVENMIKLRTYGVNSADLNLENTLQTVRYQTINAYYDVLQYINLLNVADNAVNSAKEQLDLITVQYEEGAVAKADVLQMQVQLANYKQNRTTAKSRLKVSEATLVNVIGLPEDTEIETTDKFSYQPYRMTLEECISYAFENRPDNAAAKYNLKQAQAQVDATKSGERPQITGVAGKSISSNSPFKQERNSNWNAGISIQWNIFDNNVTSAQVQAAKSDVERLSAIAEELEKRIRLEINSAYTQMKSAEENIKIAKVALQQAQESYEIAKVRYEEGVDILLTVTNAQDKLTEAQTNYYTALYDYNRYKVTLEKAMGIPINLNVPRYVSAEEEGKSAKKAFEIAKINEVEEPFK